MVGQQVVQVLACAIPPHIKATTLLVVRCIPWPQSAAGRSCLLQTVPAWLLALTMSPALPF
jgi:hypothetical protein